MRKNPDPRGKTSNTDRTNYERRDFLKAGLVSGAVAATAATDMMTSTAVADDYSSFQFDDAVPSGKRAATAAAKKIRSARKRYIESFKIPDQKDNNDENRYRYDRYIASFTKALPCNDFGEVNSGAYRKLVRAMRTGEKSDLDNIVLSPTATRKLVNPQSSLRYEISGLDSHATRIAPAKRFRSKSLAAEQAEVYWQALTRDVPFIEYDTNPIVADAVSDLNAFSKTPGLVDGSGNLDSGRLFRGETPGDLIGPYISQFLLRPFNWGPVAIEQRYEAPVPGNDFMRDEVNWLNVQRGAVGESVSSTHSKFIFNNRTLAEAVHNDALYQYYQHAALILLGGVPGQDANGQSKFDPGNPYFNGDITTQDGFTSLGGPNVLDMVAKAGNTALSGAWFQKWRIHRFLRPEALGGRVHFHKTGQRSYEVNAELLDSEAVNRTFTENGTYFLPQTYPEGSPTHPSYVAGHACVAGACVTVLKAFFNENFLLSANVQADATGDSLIPYGGDLTIGGELDKLANNVSLGRDAAGVHYRQDGIQGLICGEQQAIALLRETSKTYHEAGFGGFSLTKFDGQNILIRKGRVI
ncbi:MAG: twin-arginine translocation signal domain-containing protein [Pseudomonadota bacterium]